VILQFNPSVWDFFSNLLDNGNISPQELGESSLADWVLGFPETALSIPSAGCRKSLKTCHGSQ
ncbi:MAG: hypothetical protein ACE5G9_11465, partial [Nitrospinales bacterium]